MNAEEKKAMRERLVFQTFIEESGLRVRPKSIIESRKPPEPDILCVHENDGTLAFELVEICAEDIARKVSAIGREEFGFVRSADPSLDVLRKKLQKNYRTEYPVDLLCYTSGRVVSPDAVILATIRPLIETISRKFRRIWLLGDRCHLVWPPG